MAVFTASRLNQFTDRQSDREDGLVDRKSTVPRLLAAISVNVVHIDPLATQHVLSKLVCLNDTVWTTLGILFRVNPDMTREEKKMLKVQCVEQWAYMWVVQPVDAYWSTGCPSTGHTLRSAGWVATHSPCKALTS